jgi:hypothetical protein
VTPGFVPGRADLFEELAGYYESDDLIFTDRGL